MLSNQWKEERQRHASKWRRAGESHMGINWFPTRSVGWGTNPSCTIQETNMLSGGQPCLTFNELWPCPKDRLIVHVEQGGFLLSFYPLPIWDWEHKILVIIFLSKTSNYSFEELNRAKKSTRAETSAQAKNCSWLRHLESQLEHSLHGWGLWRRKIFLPDMMRWEWLSLQPVLDWGRGSRRTLPWSWFPWYV